MAKINFDTPIIFGALCEHSFELPRGLGRALAARAPGAILLPFQVEKRHLKNVLTCMRLMDIAGLVVMGSHQRAILGHLSNLDISAKKAGSVDVIARQKRVLRARERTSGQVHDFIGYNSDHADLSAVDLLTASMAKNTQKQKKK